MMLSGEEGWGWWWGLWMWEVRKGREVSSVEGRSADSEESDGERSDDRGRCRWEGMLSSPRRERERKQKVKGRKEKERRKRRLTD